MFYLLTYLFKAYYIVNIIHRLYQGVFCQLTHYLYSNFKKILWRVIILRLLACLHHSRNFGKRKGNIIKY